MFFLLFGSSFFSTLQICEEIMAPYDSPSQIVFFFFHLYFGKYSSEEWHKNIGILACDVFFPSFQPSIKKNKTYFLRLNVTYSIFMDNLLSCVETEHKCWRDIFLLWSEPNYCFFFFCFFLTPVCNLSSVALCSLERCNKSKYKLRAFLLHYM